MLKRLKAYCCTFIMPENWKQPHLKIPFQCRHCILSILLFQNMWTKSLKSVDKIVSHPNLWWRGEERGRINVKWILSLCQVNSYTFFNCFSKPCFRYSLYILFCVHAYMYGEKDTERNNKKGSFYSFVVNNVSLCCPRLAAWLVILLPQPPSAGIVDMCYCTQDQILKF